MNFTTKVKITESKTRIDHKTNIVLMGSCFAGNIAKLLEQYCFNAYYALGTLYNPISISNSLNIIDKTLLLSQDDIFCENGIYNSYDFHSDFSDIDKDACLDKINSEIEIANQKLQQADILIITLGTAFVYYLKENGKAVANCHHSLASKFERKRLSVNETTECLANICKQYNDKQIIFTVSPIRHLKDGAHQNQLSKASLLLAIDNVCQEFSNCEYFDSYEIVLDELRDYRFYSDDMIHIGNTAIEYIWQRFSETYFSDICRQANSEIIKINNALNHRPLRGESQEYINFKEQWLEKKQNWINKYK